MRDRKPRAAVASIAAALLVSAMMPIGVVVADSGDSPKDAEFYKLQWNLKASRAHAAFSTDAEADGSTDVLVAVVDTGIDYTHPDLGIARMADGTAGNGGRVDLARSTSLIGPRAAGGSVCYAVPHEHESGVTPGVREPGTPYGAVRTGPRGDAIEEDAVAQTIAEGHKAIDFHSHGTAVAGLIASNGLHLAGVTARTTLVSVKVHGMGRQNCLSKYVEAIYTAADLGADVIHLSIPLEWTVPHPDPLVDGEKAVERVNAALDYAHEETGAVVVVAAGNAGADLDQGTTFRFCEANHVICVGATGPASADLVEEPEWDRIAAYSNYGSDIDLVGPSGTGTYPNQIVPVWLTCSLVSRVTLTTQAPSQCQPALGTSDRPKIWPSTGNSFGAAATSGLAALMVRLIGHGQPVLVENLIEDSADDLAYLGYDPDYFGAGRINVKEAVEAAYEYLATLP